MTGESGFPENTIQEGPKGTSIRENQTLADGFIDRPYLPAQHYVQTHKK